MYVARYLSFEPLLKASGCRHTISHETRSDALTNLASQLGTTYRNLLRWRDKGIPISAAEDAAFALGDHPINIWGDEWLYACLCPVARVN